MSHVVCVVRRIQRAFREGRRQNPEIAFACIFSSNSILILPRGAVQRTLASLSEANLCLVPPSPPFSSSLISHPRRRYSHPLFRKRVLSLLDRSSRRQIISPRGPVCCAISFCNLRGGVPTEVVVPEQESQGSLKSTDTTPLLDRASRQAIEGSWRRRVLKPASYATGGPPAESIVNPGMEREVIAVREVARHGQ
ncbi:hypothetical protein JMJ77_0004183 [Colletotrichum scovillei]|uniref:Uncharacterized protein n=1 Tax=Colletotrichum scovillei TaxID=1209932 RepID=A0A9P7R0W4_9PEZI|nr:hypothetical protein JMJ77_0004183 [Colletotrichum scovillei]KAG7049435.1 hypothetical protein JMJ78_0013418 [Colletotrichum scovillei]KAG7064174.1 hypothetical protein JMJ76_0007222 [Colletotrichum scovillei]